MPTDSVDTTETRIAGRSDVADVLLSASRVLVAIAARSLADLDSDVTLAQYRALVVLASRGPRRVVDVAAELGVRPSTGTRMCDRLVRKKLIRRYRTAADRRAVWVSLTAAGRCLVDAVTARRREEMNALVEAVPQRWHSATARALCGFADQAGELPDDQWWIRGVDPEARISPS